MARLKTWKRLMIQELPMALSITFRPLLRGAGRVLDLYPDSRERLSLIRPYPNDWAALRRDGSRIGQDFQTVIRRESSADRPK